VEYSEGFTFAFISMMTLITIIWSVVLLIKCIKEVQDFSYWRALGNYILGLLIYFSLVVGAGAILAVISYAIVNFI
jgi:hypothetical protein